MENLKKNINYHYITEKSLFQRIDNFIHSNFQDIQKNRLYKIIRKGYVKVNNKKIKPYYKLQKGDIFSYHNNILIFNNQKKNSFKLNKKLKDQLLSSILYEDQYLIIINKPPGIAVHGGTGLKFGIIEIFRKLKSNYKFIELIHRLDRNTSGILMLAKKKSILKIMHQQFRDKKIYKKYIAVVHGKILKDEQKISIPIKKKNTIGKNIITFHPLGKQSISTFKVIKTFHNRTLISVILKTGKTHQIRVHAAYIGHPIIFDHIYGNHKLDNQFDKKYKTRKILLHSKIIKFYHPITNQKHFIYAPEGNRFKNYLS